ncbi:hypothetical protein BOX15_Mlig020716g1, partial [Macrostomum lignano]
PLCPHEADCPETGLLHFADFIHPDEDKDLNNSQVQMEAISSDAYHHGNSDEEATSQDDEAGDAGKKPSLQRQDTLPVNENGISESKRQKLDNSVGLPSSEPDNDKQPHALSRGLSLMRQYSAMSHAERKALVAEALAARRSLELRLARAESRERRLSSVGCVGLPVLPGELEAIRDHRYLTVSLDSSDSTRWNCGSPEESHYRLAESQFHRLLARDCVGCFQVARVEYIINPELLTGFRQFQQDLLNKDDSGNDKDSQKTVLAFHGTDESNIESICRQGFHNPNNYSAEYRQANDSGWYGRGVYFSEYPACAMDYVKGRSRLLLCLVSPGRTYQCRHYSHGQPCQPGYHSHRSPDGRELVTFDARQSLPVYVVHYERSAPDKSTAAATADKPSGPFDSLHELYFNVNTESNTSCRILANRRVRILIDGFNSPGLLLTTDQLIRFCLAEGAVSAESFGQGDIKTVTNDCLVIVLDESRISGVINEVDGVEVATVEQVFKDALDSVA